MQGLPSDNFSAENGVLIMQSTKPPYVIDPQKQAVKWLKRYMTEDPNLKGQLLQLNTKDASYLAKIELAVRSGQIVILEDVTENIDPALDPIIMKQIIRKGGRNIIKIKEKEIEYNDNFRIFMFTRQNNPNLTPELFAKVIIINFSVVREGLTDQLLSCVVRKENKELEEMKSELVTSTAAKKKQLIALEDQILDQLSNSK